jgi:2,3-diketo-5-methylthio-1-phosphopentane phosphatase
MQFTVYVDFDGTIAPADPTDGLFDEFASPEWREIEKDWHAGRRTARNCMEQQVALLRATPEAVDRFLSKVEIDPHFPTFVRLCRRQGARVVVVSDGLDRVVGTVLRAAGLDLPYFANRLTWRGGDRWQLEFPHFSAQCNAAMGNCKCSHRSAGRSTLEIMVGDGRSDFCIAERSDLVLAKDQLASHCEQAGVAHVRIKDFSEATMLLSRWFEDAQRSYSIAG